MHVNEDDPDLNYVINAYIDYYMAGLEIMNDLQLDFPEMYEDLYKLEQSYKREVSLKTRMNTDRQLTKLLMR